MSTAARKPVRATRRKAKRPAVKRYRKPVARKAYVTGSGSYKLMRPEKHSYGAKLGALLGSYGEVTQEEIGQKE